MRSSILLLLPFAVLGGCLADAPASEQDEVVAIDLANAARVEEDQLIFPAPLIPETLRQKITAYDKNRWWWNDHEDTTVEQVLFVSDRQNFTLPPDGKLDGAANNPWGFMRRALSYEIKGNDLIVATESASLADVFGELEAHGSVAIASPYPKPIHDQTVFVDRSGIELYRKGNEYVRFPSLWLNIDPEVALDLSIGAFALKHAKLTLQADIEAELVVDAQLTNLPEQAIQKTVYEQDYKLDPLGIIPVSMRVRVDVGCTKEGGPVSIEGGLRARSLVSGVVDYTREAGSSVSGSSSFEPKLIGKRFQVVGGGGARLHCTLIPYLVVMFYDLPAGALASSADLDLVMSGPPDTLVANASAKARVSGVMRVFEAGLGDAEGDLLDVDKSLWNGPVGAKP